MYWCRTKKAQYPDGAVAPKTALPYGSDSWITWNRCHSFLNKRGTYGIIADKLPSSVHLCNPPEAFIVVGVF